MAATTMHFGPEWMRAKPQSCPPRHQPSPPPQPPSVTHPLGPSSYSALLTHEPEKRDESRPFRYTKDDMLRIYREGGGRAGLNLEVERWEGIVRDSASEPAALREMSEAEKKLFTGPLNSELRRRQSTDLVTTLSSSDRQRLVHPNSATNNTARYGPFAARRRDSIDQSTFTLPRKLSVSNIQGASLTSPRDVLPSPRNRIGAFGSSFDGVLNSGDSWSRRRPSLSVTGTGGAVIARGDGKEEDARRSEIKEEEENEGYRSLNAQDRDPAAVAHISSPGSNIQDALLDDQVSSSGFDPLGQSMAGLTLETQNQPNLDQQVPSAMNLLPSGPPPGLTDLASVEWSYLDPQGQVQGPFRADLMQKWFDEGYFTPDLLTKRTHVDSDWIAVGTLERRAAGGRIFLPQISNGPPGLAVRTESPKTYSPVHEQSIFNGYPPVPSQTIRATLDSSLNGSSPIESPSSSLGGRFGNGSPDPSTIGGRPGNNIYSSDPNFPVRTFTGRAAFQDSISDARIFGNNTVGRAPPIDTLNAYSGGSDNSPWSAGSGQINQGFSDDEHHSYSNGFNGLGSGTIGNSLSANHVHGINHEHFDDATYNGMGNLGSHYNSPVACQPADVNESSFSSTVADGLGSQFGAPTQFSQSASVPYAAPQHRQSVSPFGDLVPQTTQGPNITQTPTSAVQPNSTSPWTTGTRAFEPPAGPSPIVPPARPQASEWITPQPTQPNDLSPWLMASLPVVDDVWREMPGPNSLTFSNLGQHNRLQQQEEGVNDIAVSPIEEAVAPPSDTHPAQIESTSSIPASVLTAVSHSVAEIIPSPVPDTQSPTGPKSRRKSTTRDVQASASKTVPPTTSAVIKDQPPTSVLPFGQPKPVWAVEDDTKKQKGGGATISLREIQEVEARKVEARKGAEKERERTVRANIAGSSITAEESQTFVSSWGLPTSQVGARNQTSSKDTFTGNTTGATAAAPVWTNTAPLSTTKKTMKEIQEEEKRKKLPAKESMASAAARRGHTENTPRVVPSAQTAGGSWTTVGPNGKPTPMTSVPRPSSNSSPNNAMSTRTVRSNGATIRQAVATTVKVAAPRAEEFSITPSHDFLKWLSESLKGLNSSVNLEEIASMLLSFPLDPDQSTLEIISDLIYANSTTLDGRRFASEYVNKRKADAAARRGAIGASGPGSKAVSIADVVKTQPKPVQQEWGFKVVNKKKKGGRS